MKKILFAALLLLAATAGFAQCDKPVMLTSSKTEYLDASGNVERTEDEKTTIEIRKDTMVISPGNEPQAMVAAIKSNTCNWSVPFKEGKSVIKATLNNEDGTESKGITITIEGKDGKVTLLAVMDDQPERQIRVSGDTFAEKD
jgi:hypothetical protein